MSETAEETHRRPSEAIARRPLTICAIGYASSTHVAARVRCFAELGHRVYLLSEVPSSGGIAGVTELVPAWDPALARRSWFRLLLWTSRKFAGRAAEDTWRIIAFLRFLRHCRPDIVHVHYAYSYYAWLAGIFGCRPLVVTVMGGDVLFEEQGSPTPIGKWLTLELLRKADYVTSKSNYLTEVLDRLGGYGGKAERVIWGISLRRFQPVNPSPLRDQLGLAASRRAILSAKILRPLYRVHLVVEAMAIVRARFPEAVLLVTEYAADLDYRETIASRVAELGLLDHVKFCGAVDHADMPAYYSLAELAVAVPSSDGLPQTLLEGMACRTPNILGRLPRYEEIVRHGESAYFVTATPRDIAAGMIALLEDAALRARIADNAFAIVAREGDLDEEARRVEARYYALVERVRPRTVDLAALWGTWRSFRRFRASARSAVPTPKHSAEGCN